MRVRELPEEPRLPHSRLAHERHDLAASGAALLERRVEVLDLAGPPYELREAAAGLHLKARPRRPSSGQLVDLDRLTATLHVHRAERRDLHIALDEP